MANIHFEEFVVSFESYVRIDAEGARVDTRDPMARQLVQKGGKELFEHMEPHDLAAIFSGCVGVKDLGSYVQTKALKGKLLREKLMSLAVARKMPLGVVKNHPAEAFFSALLTTNKGCELYRDIAILLAWAAEAPGIRVHMYSPCGVGSQRPPVEGKDVLDARSTVEDEVSFEDDRESDDEERELE